MLKIDDNGEVRFLEGDQVGIELIKRNRGAHRPGKIRVYGRLSRVLRVSMSYTLDSPVMSYGSVDVIITNGLKSTKDCDLLNVLPPHSTPADGPIVHSVFENSDIYRYDVALGCWVRVGVETRGGDTCCIFREEVAKE